MSRKVVEGLIDKDSDPSPKRSPAGFSWPSPSKPADKKRFAAALRELLDARDWTSRDLARELYGVKMVGGSPVPMNLAGPFGWVSGKIFPREVTARYIAVALDVPVARLLTPGAPVEAPATNGGAVTRSGNGHEVAALPLPEGEKPAVIRFETLEADSRFARVHIEGVLQVEHALTLVAMLAHRERH